MDIIAGQIPGTVIITGTVFIIPIAVLVLLFQIPIVTKVVQLFQRLLQGRCLLTTMHM